MNLKTLKFRCNVVGECWEFRTDAKSVLRKHHPMAKVDGKPKLMRRHAYELVRGSLDGCLAPFCENPACINPAHQKVMTIAQRNKLGGKAAANSPTRGAKVAQTKRERGLTKIDIDIAHAIRASEEASDVEAARYGIDPSLVTKIRRGQGWKDYTNPFSGLGARA